MKLEAYSCLSVKRIHELSESVDRIDSGIDRVVPSYDILDVGEPNTNLPVEACQVGLFW